MIRRTHTSALLAGFLALGACANDHTGPQLDAEAAENEWIVASYRQDMVRAGVIAQATIYPHHFVHGGSELNELGRRDIGYLAEHFAHSPGRLNVRRQGEGDALYGARLETVRQALAQAGVAEDRVSLGDGFAGGEGIRAERVLLVLKRDAEPLRSATSTREAATRSSQSSTTAR